MEYVTLPTSMTLPTSTALSLAQLFARHGTPKDGYPPIYEMLFRPQREKFLSVLEIGVGTMRPGVRSSMRDWALPGYKPGGSLRAWRDYFPSAWITGIDVQDDCMITDEPRIKTALCDSRNSKEVNKLLGWAAYPLGFDLIIDDGDHRVDAQLHTCRNLWQYLRFGGYYVIEDATELPDDPKGLGWLHDFTNGSPRMVIAAQHNNLFNNLIVMMK